jgi:hypothetical protein
MGGDVIVVIVVAVVFLGGMGGLLIYANTGKKDDSDVKENEEKH